MSSTGHFPFRSLASPARFLPAGLTSEAFEFLSLAPKAPIRFTILPPVGRAASSMGKPFRFFASKSVSAVHL